MINPVHLKEHVIVPTLKYLDMYSDAAVNLLLGTAAQESGLGHYLVQLNGGPARGIYQMEPFTSNCILRNHVKHRKSLRLKVTSLVGTHAADTDPMVSNLAYATAMARLHYMRVPFALPHADDVSGLAHYWKEHYNTHLGKGTVEEFMENYARFGIGVDF